jgi:RimJ/RimL family protein N-acetyltransferase
MKIVPLEDLEDARELHKLAFPSDHYPDPGCMSWAMMDENGQMVGYAAARMDSEGQLYIERVAAVQGAKVAPRLVRHVLRWGKKLGCETAHTYILLKNYASIFLFKKLGFVFFEPASNRQYVGPDVHYLWKAL